MRLFQLVVFIFASHCISAQTIFNYEKKISPSKNLAFQEISFINSEEGIQLSGTLIYPKEGFDKIVMIVPGSGKDTRHSHFILTEHFLKRNIAVYRFDDRGVGRSEGKFIDTASGLTKDVVDAYHTLRKRSELLSKKIGILGHSLGGIASIGAYDKGCDFDFLVQMASPVENNGAFLKYQASTMTDGWSNVKNKSAKEVISFIEALVSIVQVDDDFNAIKQKAKVLIKKRDFKKGRHIINPIIIDLIKQNYENTYQTCAAPVLYIIGTEDKHVSRKNEIIALKRLGNPNIEAEIIENVDHYLSDRLATSVYSMNETAINVITNWILEK